MKLSIITASIISDSVMTNIKVDPDLDLTGYKVGGIAGNIITLYNKQGFKIEIEAQFNVKAVGKNEL